MAAEMNFDGIVGPTFNHGGFAFGNLASTESAGSPSRPKQAALQGLTKMRALHDLGIPQGVLPPHFRPQLNLAHRLGFKGSDAQVLDDLARDAPAVLAACYSASSMWAANAATVCPSADASDGRVHFTPANLQNQIHRFIEAPTTRRILQAVFRDPTRFAVHDPLPASATLGDEGAANHTRLCENYADPGLQLFVYGQVARAPSAPKPRVFPARQTLEACETLIRLHRIPSQRVVLAQQNPDAIDAGVFHNDVISVGNRNVFLVHEAAFVDTSETLERVSHGFETLCGSPLSVVRVPTETLDLDTCVATYLFNSQLVSPPGGESALVCPTECRDHPRVRSWLDAAVSDPDTPITSVHFHDVRQSMHGGGGPACLRLRVVLTEAEREAIAPGVAFTPALHDRLVEWVHRHYRDELRPEDLKDPDLMEESMVALDALTELLGLGSLYDFQRVGPAPVS